MDDIIDYIKQIYRGRTIYRMYLNRLIKKHSAGLAGEVLDLASGGRPSYEQYLPRTVRLVRTDYRAGEGIDAVVDLNQPLPFAEGSQKAVFLFNALYTLEDPNGTLREIFRVLAPGGMLFLSSPFIANEMPEPHDYRRWTKEGLDREFQSAGFSSAEIIRFGERFTSAAYLLHPLFYFKTIKLVAYALAILGDRLLPARIKKNYPVPLGYFCVAKK